MSDCERFERIFDDSTAGVAGADALEALRDHARACGSCRELLEIHDEMRRLAARAADPEDSRFVAMRARVLGQLAAGGGGRTAREGFPRLASERGPRWMMTSSPARVAAALAAAAVVFAAGLAAGRGLENGSIMRSEGNGAGDQRLVRAISVEAAGNTSLRDVEESPWIFSNVTFRPLGEGRIALDFDVTTHVGLVEPIGSDVVQEVLAQSLLDPSSTGARLRAMSYAKGAMNPKVREALLLAMRRDDELAVRLKALEILSEHLDDPEVEAGVIATLRDDGSVQMRLLALDLLAAQGPDPEGRDRILRAIRESEAPGDEALMVRFSEHLKRY